MRQSFFGVLARETEVDGAGVSLSQLAHNAAHAFEPGKVFGFENLVDGLFDLRRAHRLGKEASYHLYFALFLLGVGGTPCFLVSGDALLALAYHRLQDGKDLVFGEVVFTLALAAQGDVAVFEGSEDQAQGRYRLHLVVAQGNLQSFCELFSQALRHLVFSLLSVWG